jgi:hypothetical protein
VVKATALIGSVLLAMAGAWGAEGVPAPGLTPVGEVSIAAGAEVARAEENFQDLETDDTGRIWAAPSGHAQELASFGADGKGQRLRLTMVPAEAHAQLLRRLPDGSVVCLWSESADTARHLVTVHRGDAVRVWASFECKLKEPRLFGCRDGALLITEKGPSVVQLRKDDAAGHVLTLPDELFRAPARKPENPSDRYFAPVCALEDDTQRVWLWSNALNSGEAWRLAGLVALREGSFEQSAITGLPADARFSALSVAESGRLWLPVVRSGLYKLELATSRAELEKIVDPPQFHYLEKVFLARGEWIALLGPQPMTFDGSQPGVSQVDGRVMLFVTSHHDPTLRTGSLARFRDGAWQVTQNNLDLDPRPDWIDRPIVETPRGLYIGSVGSGPWFLPADATIPPALLDWRHGFPLPDARRFFPVGPDRLVALDGRGRLGFADTIPKTLTPKDQRAERVRFRKPALQDRRGHVWTFGPGNAFREWDGRKAIPRSPPNDFLGKVAVRDFASDDRDRGWLISDDHARTAICDFATGQWQVFETFTAALVAQLPEGVRLAMPADPFYEPIFSSQGHIAFFDLRNGISRYDGHAWQQWSIAAIAGGQGRLTGSPFFDADGRLCVPIDGLTYQWNADGGWRHFEQPDAAPPSTRPKSLAPEVPPSIRVRDPASAVEDRFGTWWVLSKENALSKAVPGVAVQALRADEPNPFPSGARLYEALADPLGNVFLRLSEYASMYCEYVYLSRLFAPPKTMIDKVEVEGDTARFHFSVETVGTAAPPSIFRWRLDGGEWRLLGMKNDATARMLARGEHRVEARAYAGDLVADPTPAEARFTIEIDADAQQRKLLAQLASADLDERERAARALVRLGSAALPRLQAERKAAQPDVVWWIDAVLQQIERARVSEPAK